MKQFRGPLVRGVGFLLFLLTSSCLAKNNLYEERLINPAVGVFGFEVPGIPPFDGTPGHEPNYDLHTEVIVIQKRTGKTIQRIPFYGRWPVSYIDYLDVDGDGYLDLLVGDADNLQGPITGADVWLYSASAGRFIKNEELSGIGSITKKKRHCVTIESKPIRRDYLTQEWCVDAKKRWTLRSQTGGGPEFEDEINN